jgi:phosphatidylinositol alpha-1,6-mannosyltransferase
VIAPAAPDAAQLDRTLPFEVRRVAANQNLFFVSSALTLAKLSAEHATFHSQWFSAPGAQLLRQAGRLGAVCVAAHGRELLLGPWSQVGVAQAAYDRLRRRALRQADGVFAVSRFSAGLVLGLGVDQTRLEVHPNGADPERFHPGPRQRAARRAPDAEFVVLCVARLVQRKGVDVVLQAFQQLCDRGVNARLYIVGEGPEGAALRQLSQSLGARSRISFAGSVSEAQLLGLYQTADVFVLPARSEGADVEGYGLVFLEANACGLPVIGPDEGGPAEAIEPGVTGLCVPARSSEALGEALWSLACDPELCARLGEQGRQRVLSERNWDHVAKRLLLSIEARQHQLTTLR